MKKRIFGLVVILVLSLSLCILGVNANNKSGRTIKKIVSVAYDDSGSMYSNDNWTYASYSLQNMIGLMNSNDEINVVRMSNLNNVEMDLSKNDKRKNDIKSVEGWNVSGGTETRAIELAGNWLKGKKNEYKGSQDVEFWLIILTDGGFYEQDRMTKYFNDLKNTMSGSKFEGVFVAIGNSVPVETTNTWNNTMKEHLITASNKEGIISAMFEVSGLVMGQGRKDTSIKINKVSGGDSVEIDMPFPVRKFIVFEQEQDVSIKKVTTDGMKINTVADFNGRKPGSGRLDSRIIHCEGEDGKYIPAGKIKIDFNKKIDIENKKFKILTEAAVELSLKVVDKQGNIIDDIDSVIFSEGETIEIAAVVNSELDGEKVSLREFADDIDANLVINGKEVEMKYSSKDDRFYATYKVEEGDNLASAVVNLPGYFRTKSDVLNISPKEVVETPKVTVSSGEVIVPYDYTDEYEEIGIFTYMVTGEYMDGLCDFEFKNMPKGITVSVNDVFADENGKLSVKIYNNVPAMVKFYRNKDYKETEDSRISIDVKSSKYELQWKENSITEIILKPEKRNITFEKTKTENADLLKLNNFNGKDIYIISVLANDEYLTKEELENIVIEKGKVKGISLETEVIEYNGRYALRVKCKKTLPQLFIKTGKVNIDMVVRTMYGEVSDNIDISFNMGDSLTKYIVPAIILMLIIIVIGYIPGVKKKLYNRKYHIQVNGEDEAIYVKFITRMIPYVTEKGVGGDLKLVATSNKNKVLVINNFNSDQKLYLDDEVIEDGTKKFDLPINSKLKVVDIGREIIYTYCDSRSDSVGNGDFSNLDDMNIFGYGEDTSFTSSDSSDDDFFG